MDCKQVENTPTSFGSRGGGVTYHGIRGSGLRWNHGYRAKYSTYMQTFATFIVRGNPNTNARKDIHDKWIIDSGATRHITNNANLIQNISKATGDFVAVINGSETQIQGQGYVAVNVVSDGITRRLQILDVALVPELFFSLLSVSQLRRKVFRVEFTGGRLGLSNGTVSILKESTGKIIALGIENMDGLYEMLFQPC